MCAQTADETGSILVLSSEPAPSSLESLLNNSAGNVAFLNPFDTSSRSELVHRMLDADLVICCGATPEMYYLLGIAEAIGKPSIFWNENGVSQELRRLGASVTGDEPQWDLRKLRDSTSVVPIVKADKRPVHWSLSGEIRANMIDIANVQARDLMFAGILHDLNEKSLIFVNCRTEVYDSEIVQWTLTRMENEVRRLLSTIYADFEAVNKATAAAGENFTVPNVQRYLKAIRAFERGALASAEDVLTYLLDREL